MTVDRPGRADPPLEAAGAAAAAVVGVLLEGAGATPGLAAAIGAGLASPASLLLSRVRDEFRGRATAVIVSAVIASDLTDDEFLVRLAADQRLSTLATRALEAARVSSYLPKLRALGWLLGEQAAGKRPAIDETEIFAQVLEGIEAAHVRVLMAMIEEVRLTDLPRPAVAERAGLSKEVLSVVQATLARLGLADSPTRPGAIALGSEVNAFGREIAKLIELASDYDPGPQAAP